MRLLFLAATVLRRYRRFRVASSYPAKHRVDMNYAALSSISRICKRIPGNVGIFFLGVDAISGGGYEGERRE